MIMSSSNGKYKNDAGSAFVNVIAVVYASRGKRDGDGDGDRDEDRDGDRER